MLWRKKTKEFSYENPGEQIKGLEIQQLCQSLDSNIELVRTVFHNDDTLIFHKFENQINSSIKCGILYIDGMVNVDLINENIIKPIIINQLLENEKNLMESLQHHVVLASSIHKTSVIEEIVQSVIDGNSVLFLDGYSEALTIDSQGWQMRSIEEPQVEKALRGPREGFTESLMVNLSLIRRKIKTPKLKFKMKRIGTVSNTKLCLCYIEGIANKRILKELEKRIDEITIDGVLDTGYIQELIKDAPLSPFKTIGSTERPDVVAGKILEGRIAIILDGTPVLITVPYLFIEYFHVNEDYYDSYYFASIGRILRVLGFILTISVPAIYTALITFHQEMIPTQLLISISEARQGIPFPTLIEALGLLLVFEILRETGTRTPSYMGQALSIVGALVIGQAAVEARFVSAPIVIIIAFSGITGLMIPKIKGAVIMIRITFILLAAFLGLYGFTFGVMALMLHLFEIRSFGIPYMSNLSSFDPQEFKDTFIRAPWWYMKYRPKFIAPTNRQRK